MSGLESALAALEPWRVRIDALLATSVMAPEGAAPVPVRLAASMNHLLLAKGKRVRPMLAVAVASAIRPDHDEQTLFSFVGPAACSLEMLHTYSLVHDDLPAMDDDALRRGMPTVHVAFDEATAILAGDALLTDAFAILATAKVRAAEQVRVLAVAAGSSGMVGGQYDDIHAHRDAQTLPSIHLRKTAMLLEAACSLGALSVDATADQLQHARVYGRELGMAFQIVDDVLDATADVAAAGKELGRDAKANKVTYLSVYGAAEAMRLAKVHAARAVQSAEALRSKPLVDLLNFVVDRAH